MARKKRARPGTRGGGEYFRIVVRPKEEFATFRYQVLGEKGDLKRLAGRRQNGSWDTQAWLISKESAHIEGERLVPDTAGVKELLEKLGSAPKHVKVDIFQAKDRVDIPESEKPTAAQRRAQTRNIKKAQAARK